MQEKRISWNYKNVFAWIYTWAWGGEVRKSIWECHEFSFKSDPWIMSSAQQGSLWHIQASSETGNVSKVEMPLPVIVSITAFSWDMAAKVYSIKLSSILICSATLLGEGDGNPLQYSCLENPRDGGAWWAAVYGVAQSRTRLKRLSSSSSSSRTHHYPSSYWHISTNFYQLISKLYFYLFLRTKVVSFGREILSLCCNTWSSIWCG